MLLILAIVFFAAAAALGAFLLYCSSATEADPSPDSEGRVENADGFPEVDWDYWLSVNPDIIGWVTVPDTDIDFPIVQASEDDPDYYLTHDVQGNWNVYGAVYLDADCAEDGLTGSGNAIVYGHHMNDGTMFSAFASYLDEDYAQEHATILLQTPEEQVVMEVRFVEVADASTAEKTVSFLDESAHLTWYTNHLRTAAVVLDSESRPDTAVTFCTCSYTLYADERTLVVCSPVEDDADGDEDSE